MPKKKITPAKDLNDAATDIRDGGGLDKRTGKAVAGGAGGVAGAAGGAAIGSLAGPIGTVVGALAGALGGWWAGKNVAENVSDFDSHDDYYRSHFKERAGKKTTLTYERAKPIYQVGHLASLNPNYKGRRFEEIEPELRRGWTQDMSRQYGDWDTVRGFAAEAYNRGEQRVITRSEEELAIGKRPVEAGEVQLRKTVETEHRTENVPVMREEVTVERRPVDQPLNAAGIEIEEDEIRIPITEEEVTVEKKPVVKEEILLKKHAVEDTKKVQADLRKERVDVDDSQIKTRGRKHTIDADEETRRR